MGIIRKRPSSTATSPCAHLRTAYHNCFNKWYSEKFLKGQWNKEECVSEWDKYRECLSQHLDDKHLSRFLEADAVIEFHNQAEFKGPSGVSSCFPFCFSIKVSKDVEEECVYLGATVENADVKYMIMRFDDILCLICCISDSCFRKNQRDNISNTGCH